MPDARGIDHVALLRGINVGGRNLVPMADLRAALQDGGFADVATYIQSGNALFRAPRRPRAELTAQVEEVLRERLRIDLKVAVLTAAQLRAVVTAAPDGFGADGLLCDVLFVRPPLSARTVLEAIEPREGVDRMWPGKGVVYFARAADRASQSRLSKFASRPQYQEVTVRSWSTTLKLQALMEARAAQ